MKIRYTIELNVTLEPIKDEKQLETEFYSPNNGFQSDLRDFLNDNEFTYCCGSKIKCEDEYCISKNDKVNNSSSDVAPVRHGKWNISEYEFFDCSACGDRYYTGAASTAQAKSYLSSGHFYKFCPHCGAKMDGVKDEN